MKICSICSQTYADDNLNFCLNDGGTLTVYADDAPPTVMFKPARPTGQNWENYQTNAPWGNQPLQQNQPFQPVPSQSPNQTLPTISLVLGIFGILVICCYGGIPLGAAALITGYLGLKNANENPMQYGGRGLAIAGMITGAVGLVISLVILIISVAAGVN